MILSQNSEFNTLLNDLEEWVEEHDLGDEFYEKFDELYKHVTSLYHTEFNETDNNIKGIFEYLNERYNNEDRENPQSDLQIFLYAQESIEELQYEENKAREELENASAIQMQRIVRGRAGRNEAKKISEGELKEAAATKIQAVVRGSLLNSGIIEEKLEANRQAKKMTGAVTDIQRVFRGSLVRKKMDAEELDKTGATRVREEKAKELKDDTIRNKIDDEEPIAGYYNKDYLHNKIPGEHGFFRSKSDDDKNKTNVGKINGLHKEKDKNDKTVFVTDTGFPIFHYDNDGLTTAHEVCQKDIGSQYSYLNDELIEGQNPLSEDYTPYDSISFIRINAGASFAGGDSIGEEGKNFKYGYVISSKQSVETCYLTDGTFEQITQDYDKQYKELIDFRRGLSSFTTQYDALEKSGKESSNEQLANFFKDSGIEISGVNSFWNKIDDLAREGKIKELQKAKTIFDDYVETYNINLEDHDPKIPVDNFFANRVKTSLSNSFHNGLIADSQKLRDENRASFNLTKTEKEGIKALGGYYDKLGSSNKREIGNIDTLLGLDFPATPYDGIYVKRHKVTPYNLDNTFFNKTVETEFAAVVFKGDTTDNIMYLTLKGTDFHVKVRMDPITKEIKIDKDNLYKKNATGRWEDYTIERINREVNNNKLDSRNKKIKEKFRNFGVIAMSDIDGVRKVSMLHNLKENSFNLQSELSKDVFKDRIDDATQVRMGTNIKGEKYIDEVKDGILSREISDFDDTRSELSDPGKEIKEPDQSARSKLIDKINKKLDEVHEYCEREVFEKCEIDPEEEVREDGNFSYTVSKNIYAKVVEDGQEKYLHVGYELQRVEFSNDGIETNIDKTTREYMSCDDYNAMTSKMSSLKEELNNGQIMQETYDECKSYMLNKFDEIVHVRKSGDKDITQILGTKNDAEIYESTANYNRIVAHSKDSGYLSTIIDESMIPQDRTLRRYLTNYDKTAGVERASKAKESGNGEIDTIRKVTRDGLDLSEIVTDMRENGAIPSKENQGKSFQELVKTRLVGSSDVGRGGGSSPAA